MKPFRPLILFMSAAAFSRAAVWVAAPDGTDANPGTIDRPFRTLAKAVSAAAPGDTVYVRGGTWRLADALRIGADRSGRPGLPVRFFAFPGERPLLDFASSPQGRKGVLLQASHWHIRGFGVRGAGDNGMDIDGGSHNTVERCDFFENRDSGLQLSNGAADNRILHCDSYRNADPPDYADADGFAPKLTVGSGNYFRGCRAWENCDDGWDGYLRGANDVATILDSCWTWRNGFLADGSDPGPKANGNGFKMGGGDDGNSQRLMHHFTLTRCVAFDNKAKGFDQNHNMGFMILRHCSGFRNRAADFSLPEKVNDGQEASVRNSLSYPGSASLDRSVVQGPNSWQSAFRAEADDFAGLDTAGVSGPRDAHGGLPVLDFLRLAEGSDLIDAGEPLGRPFLGSAPDLGAFESPFVNAVSDPPVRPDGFSLDPAFPNPFNSRTVFRYRNPVSCRVTLTVLDVSGRLVETLMDAALDPGTHETAWDAGNRSSGVYLVRFSVNGHSETRKILLQK
ncbi:MAG: right-handed parallel beta-helix repeat-containing protein [bacterium]|nr:right-handed parallel beta-helix repeat-containing protein [bacterium]